MSEILVEGKYFRVIQAHKDIGKGLYLEFKSNSSTIAYITPFITDYMGEMSPNCIEFRDIGFRSIDCLDPTNPLMIEEYKNCVEFARKALEDILCK